MQGRSQRGVQGVQLNPPPSKLMIFMTIVYAYEKIDGRNILECMLIQHILRISYNSYSFVGYNNKKNPHKLC